jgi:DNA-binding CsgD family transcriptional regulator
LSEREKELHGLLLTEATLATIAKAMGVQRTTVATLAARLYRKLGVKGRVGLAPLALGRTGSTR